MTGNRVHLTAGRDPYRTGDGGPRTQPGSGANVEGLDRERRTVVTAIEKRLLEAEHDMTQGRKARARDQLPEVIALVEQARTFAGHKKRDKRLAALIRQSKYPARLPPPTPTGAQGLTKRLRPRT